MIKSWKIKKAEKDIPIWKVLEITDKNNLITPCTRTKIELGEIIEAKLAFSCTTTSIFWLIVFAWLSGEPMDGFLHSYDSYRSAYHSYLYEEGDKSKYRRIYEGIIPKATWYLECKKLGLLASRKIKLLK